MRSSYLALIVVVLILLSGGVACAQGPGMGPGMMGGGYGMGPGMMGGWDWVNVPSKLPAPEIRELEEKIYAKDPGGCWW